jgi:hypothetical protein
MLENALVSQLEIEKLTCAEVNHFDTDASDNHIMQQINKIYNDYLDNFTMTNSSDNVSNIIFNFTFFFNNDTLCCR